MKAYHNAAILAARKSGKIHIGANVKQLLLDLYPDAAVAYSVRKLRTAYNGNCLRVRRSSDNAEQDIGFKNGYLDTSALLSFVGANDGFVVTLYDQSVNVGRDLTQSIALNQPKIVNVGVVDLINGKPCISSNNKSLSNSSFSTIPIRTDFFVFKIEGQISANFECYYDGVGTILQRGYFGNDNQSPKNDIPFDGTVLVGYSTTLNQTLATVVRNKSNSKIYKNNNLEATGNSGVNSTFVGLRVGRDYNDSTPSNIKYQELVIYDNSVDISGINMNINKYYSIY